jgi:hypothetical protein
VGEITTALQLNQALMQGDVTLANDLIATGVAAINIPNGRTLTITNGAVLTLNDINLNINANDAVDCYTTFYIFSGSIFGQGAATINFKTPSPGLATFRVARLIGAAGNFFGFDGTTPIVAPFYGPDNFTWEANTGWVRQGQAFANAADLNAALEAGNVTLTQSLTADIDIVLPGGVGVRTLIIPSGVTLTLAGTNLINGNVVHIESGGSIIGQVGSAIVRHEGFAGAVRGDLAGFREFDNITPITGPARMHNRDLVWHEGNWVSQPPTTNIWWPDGDLVLLRNSLMTSSLFIDVGRTLTIPNGVTLTMQTGSSANISGTVAIQDGGQFISANNIPIITITPTGSITGAGANVLFIDSDGVSPPNLNPNIVIQYRWVSELGAAGMWRRDFAGFTNPTLIADALNSGEDVTVHGNAGSFFGENFVLPQGRTITIASPGTLNTLVNVIMEADSTIHFMGVNSSFMGRPGPPITTTITLAAGAQITGDLRTFRLADGTTIPASITGPAVFEWESNLLNPGTDGWREVVGVGGAIAELGISGENVAKAPEDEEYYGDEDYGDGEDLDDDYDDAGYGDAGYDEDEASEADEPAAHDGDNE